MTEETSNNIEEKPLQIEIFDRECLSHFPAHGWARNPEGVKLLWFPIKTLFDDTQRVRSLNGIKDDIPRDKPRSTVHEQICYALPVNPSDPPDSDRTVTIVPGPISSVPFYTCLNEIAILLKEVHRYQRLQQSIDIMELKQMLPLYLKWLYIEFRQVMDLFAMNVGRLVFQKTQNLPGTFPDLKRLVADEKRINSYGPTVDIGRLNTTLTETSSWFDILRDPAGGHQGLRDALMHGNVRILLGGQREGDGAPKITAHLSSRPTPELFATVPIITSGLCRLFTEVCSIVTWRGHYSRVDCLPVWGNDEDSTGFWPEI